MSGRIHDFRAHAKAQAEQLIHAIETAERMIVTTIERECEALRGGRMLAAKALHTHLSDAARLYLNATRAARASLWSMQQALPGCRALLEERRAAFASLLKIELAVLAVERAAAGEEPGGPYFTDPAMAAEPEQRSGRLQTPAPGSRIHAVRGRARLQLAASQSSPRRRGR
jgi:hypothetical protein